MSTLRAFSQRRPAVTTIAFEFGGALGRPGAGDASERACRPRPWRALASGSASVAVSEAAVTAQRSVALSRAGRLLSDSRLRGHTTAGMTLRMDLSVRIERWPLAGAFTISRGSKTEAVVVVAELSDGTHRGRGECVPYARYGETPDGIVAAIEAMRPALHQGLDRAALQKPNAPGAARNALDCAYWDVNAKQSGRRVYELAGLVAPEPRVTASTISLAASAQRARFVDLDRPLLLARDRAGGLRYDGSLIYPPESALWG